MVKNLRPLQFDDDKFAEMLAIKEKQNKTWREIVYDSIIEYGKNHRSD